MKWIVLFALTALVLSVTATASSRPAVSDQDLVQRAFGGGHVGPNPCFADGSGAQTVCLAGERDFSLGAIGSIGGRATGTLHYGNNAANVTNLRGRVTCMERTGNRASLGGWIVSHRQPDFVGAAFFFYVVDNGPAGSASRDRISAVEVSVDPAERPVGFPARCPAVDEASFGFTDLVHGDVTLD
jgi:hypothetical protein